MISPLGQRQILQTAAVETVRQAMEGGAQAQRELARKQAFDAKLAEAMTDVKDIAESEGLRQAEHGPDDQSGRQHGTGASEGPQDEGEGDHLQAEGAWPHLDLLA